MKFLSSCANSFSIISESADDTFLVGRTLGESLYPGLLILLKGELGMGKTRFTQGIGRALGYDRVKSPTFVIMNEYDATFVIMNEYDADVPFLHADLYRLEDEDEIESLGIEEYLDDGFAAAVEERWRERPEERLEVELLPVPGDTEARTLVFEAFGKREAELLAVIKEKLFPGEDK